MQENNKIFLGLGSNLGNRDENLDKAIALLQNFIKITKTSPIYETEPVGFEDQPQFLNMIIEAETLLSPQNLLKKTQEIENQLGRKKEFKNSPREIDIDILFFNKEIIDQENLKIPHPQIQNRKFVLKPFSDISPDFIHPTLDKSIKELLNTTLDTKKIKPWTQTK